jgi:predicted lysophospholipase L1 biosynthesis ABC-type transport system permease subunit
MVGLLAAAPMTAFAGARRTASSYDRFRASTRSHDMLATASDEAPLERIAKLPGVEAAAIGSIHPAFVDLERSQFDLGILAGEDGNLGRTVDRGRLLAGRLPRPDRPDEVALNEEAARQLHARVGSVVTLQTLTPAQQETIETEFSGTAEGPRLRLMVTAVVRNPEDLRGEQASSLILGTAAFERKYKATVSRYAVFGAFRLRGGEAAAKAFSARARPLLGTEGAASLVPSSDTSESVRDALRFLSTGLSLVGLAALLVGLVAGGQALARQLAQSGPDQPVLAALGLTRTERAAAVAALGLPVAAVAGVVAAVGAVLASPLTPINIGRQAEPHPGVAFDALVHLVGAALTVGLVALAAMAVAWAMARSRIGRSVERVRPTTGARVARVMHLGPGSTTGVRMALEPGSGRTAVPVRSALVAALVAVAGVVGSLTFASSLDRLNTTPARYGQPWDLTPDVFAKDVPRIVTRRDVGEMAAVHRTSVVLQGHDLSGYAVEPLKGSPQLVLMSGRPPANSREVALGRDLLRSIHRRVGDAVDFAARTGRPRTFHVVGTVLTPSLDLDPIAGSALFTMDGLEAVRQSDAEINGVIQWRSGVDGAAAEARFRKAYPSSISAYGHPRPPGEVANLDRVNSLPPLLAAFLATVGLVGLLHALVTSTRRRRQDLAVLRAMGFVGRQVRAALSAQAATIALVGLVLGLPLGIALGRWAWILTADGIGVATDPLVPLVSALLLVPAALAAALLLGVPLGARAARLAPAAVLRTE